jgi:hypothetical protein
MNDVWLGLLCMAGGLAVTSYGFIILIAALSR